MADDNTTQDVRNIAKGIRGINAVDGYVELNPGEVRKDVELTSAELKSAKRTGYFEFGTAATKPAATDGDDLDITVAKLKELAVAEDIDLGTATAKADIQDAIRKGRVAKATAAAEQQTDDLDNMNDADLRVTVQALTGSEPPADADRETLLKLARGQD